jgi:hypothetical protein
MQTSTVSETASRRTDSTIAASTSLCSARYTASGMVWVTPGMLPANVMVAPNSPSARAQLMAAPASSDGAASGTRTRRNAVPGVPAGWRPRRDTCDPLPRSPPGRRHEEGRGHEGLCHDHAQGRERKTHAEQRQGLPGQARPAEGREQGHPGHGWREHHRQVDQHLQGALAPEIGHVEGVCDRQPSATTVTVAASEVTRLSLSASRMSGCRRDRAARRARPEDQTEKG